MANRASPSRSRTCATACGAPSKSSTTLSVSAHCPGSRNCEAPVTSEAVPNKSCEAVPVLSALTECTDAAFATESASVAAAALSAANATLSLSSGSILLRNAAAAEAARSAGVSSSSVPTASSSEPSSTFLSSPSSEAEGFFRLGFFDFACASLVSSNATPQMLATFFVSNAGEAHQTSFLGVESQVPHTNSILCESSKDAIAPSRSTTASPKPPELLLDSLFAAALSGTTR